ncbi:hypothetical protein [Sinosporangium siamense]|uniref:Uncharacterized protein n=1 Tax=Sinosporangium siamense TaxID=1367973 RepID=A0A919RQK0_9ACTN|nr:hypothetical protein [Sinosporangium siamense]GII97220.1 hypothetical protein Ssi02_74510 [Sinosporangium siamense]
MRRLAAVLLLAVTAVGCGIQPTGITPAGDAPIARASTTTNAVYFVKKGKLVRVTRTAPLMPANGYALMQLVDGPTAAEAADGITTAIDGSGYGIEVEPEGDAMVLTLEKRPTGAALGQWVCTADAMPGVNVVRIVDWVRADDVESHMPGLHGVRTAARARPRDAASPRRPTAGSRRFRR